MAAFPNSPDALSKAWLSAALGYPVRSFQVSYFGEGAGIMALVTRLHLEADQGPQTLIAKFPSPAPENRAVAQTYDMYGREVRFYRDIADGIRLRTPACHHAQFDQASQDFVLLIEDLKGYRIGDQVAGCSRLEALAVVEAIAQLHSSVWERTPPGVISHNNPMQRDGMIAGFQTGWPVVVKHFGELIPQGALAAGKKMPGKVADLLEAMCTPPICLSHADVRLDNIFFQQAACSENGQDSRLGGDNAGRGRDEESGADAKRERKKECGSDAGDAHDASWRRDSGVVLVDWQSLCTSAPEQDLAYFVTQSIPPDIRAKEDWVARYHEALARRRLDYDLDRSRERFRVAALYLLCYAVVIAGTLDMGNERGQALARTLLGNSFSALDEMDAFALLG